MARAAERQGGGMKILLVDDEPALRELLRVTFEGAEVTVDEAGSAAEAETRIQADRPDLIVLDLRHMLALERRQRALLEGSYLETVTALATALEWKDTSTHDHSQRVVRYALELLATIDPGFVGRDRGIEYGFLLHDVGKIGIP